MAGTLALRLADVVAGPSSALDFCSIISGDVMNHHWVSSSSPKKGGSGLSVSPVKRQHPSLVEKLL